MAIKDFKSILDKTGYYVSEKDRKIFERGSLPAFFGRGQTDTIEFILYDQADNILPQGKRGLKVRYVDITDKESIRRYILIVRPQVSNQPNEYFVDVEKLINEAGYKNGIFKTQVTLLNKRVGSERKQNKLWVHEISPSRTEIRVLPLKVDNERLQQDILTRYDIFLRDGEFRDDIVNRIQSFQSTLSAEKVKKALMQSYGEDWVNLVKSEFQVPDIDDFLRRVVEKSKEAINYFIGSREWKIGSRRYGEPLKKSNASAALDIMKLYKVSNRIVCDVIESFLPKRNIIGKTYASPELVASRDKVAQILQEFTSNKTLDTKASVVAKIIKPRPVKKGNIVINPPPPPPPKPEPIIIKTPAKKYYFYSCNSNGKIGKPGIFGRGHSAKGGGGCYQMLSAFFSYENMAGDKVKFNLLPGSSSKICALEGSVKVSGGGRITKQELCQVKNYKPYIVTPKPYVPPKPEPIPPPIVVKKPDLPIPPKPVPDPIIIPKSELFPIVIPPIVPFTPDLDFKFNFPPIDLGMPKIGPIKWPLTISGGMGGVGGNIPPVTPPFKPIFVPPKTPIDTSFGAGGTFGGNPGGSGGARSAGMGTFGGYNKTNFGSGFNPFSSIYGGF
tara:strand:+ start:18834 stop:20672 length:1839 start_codon:yes stop_codon:yes gene_type:complete